MRRYRIIGVCDRQSSFLDLLGAQSAIRPSGICHSTVFPDLKRRLVFLCPSYYQAKATGIVPASQGACLTSERVDLSPIVGCGIVKTVPVTAGVR